MAYLSFGTLSLDLSMQASLVKDTATQPGVARHVFMHWVAVIPWETSVLPLSFVDGDGHGHGDGRVCVT
jgi:hypothetical protein